MIELPPTGRSCCSRLGSFVLVLVLFSRVERVRDECNSLMRWQAPPTDATFGQNAGAR